MDSKKSETSDIHRLLLNLREKTNLKRGVRYAALSNLSIYDTWKNIKKSYKSNKCKISVPTWNQEFESPDGSYSTSDIQNHFNKKRKRRKIVNPSIKIYENKSKQVYI